MRTKSGKHLWPIPALVLLAVAGAFAVMFSVGLFTPNNSAEATVTGPIAGEPFPVGISRSLVSQDINGDGDLDDLNPATAFGGTSILGDVDAPVVSSYTFTVKSTAAFADDTLLTVTFPAEYDLTKAVTTSSNFQIYDPTDKAFENATAASLTGATSPTSGGVFTLTFGGLGAAIPVGGNITARVQEAAIVRSPVTPGGYKLTVSTSADTTVATSQTYRHGGRMLLTPDDPGAIAEYRFSFYAKNDLIADQDKIIFTFDDDFRSAFPTVIAPSAITIRANRIKNGSVIITPTTATTASTLAQPNRVVRPSISPSFDLVSSESDEPQIKITVPDMDPSQTDTNSGSQDIAKNALVTVTLSSAAGIQLPTEAGTPFQFEEFHDNDFRVRTTDGTGFDPQSGSIFNGTKAAGDQTNIFLDRQLDLNDDDAGKGRTITAVGKGYKNGTQVTVFIDKNNDGVLQKGTESELAKATVGSDDTFTAQFVVDARFSSVTAENPIQAIDGEGNVACDFFPGSAGICGPTISTNVGPTNFNLEGSMVVSPTSGDPGDEFNVTLRDFENGASVVAVLMGGIAVKDPSGITFGTGVGQKLETLSNGTVTFKAEVPDAAPEGPQTLSVTVQLGTGTPEDEQARFTVGGSTLTMTPAVVTPNQDLTISGSGFTTEGKADICQDNITIGGEAVEIASDSKDSTANDTSATKCAGANPGNFVNVTSGGTFVVTVPVPVTSSLVDAGIDGQALEVKMTDTRGRSGTAFVEVPKRTMIVTPEVSGTRSLLTIRGTGFPADNSEGVSSFSSNITVTYEHDSGTKTTSETPDTNGNFTVTMTVPTNAPIPSENTIRGVVDLPAGGKGADTTVIHEIPGGTVIVEPGEGPSGATVRVRGLSFKAFTALKTLEFGGLGTLGGRTVNTDENGDWEATDILVPQLETGTHSVIAKVGDVTANTAFTILDSGAARPPGEGTPVLDAVAPIGENLERSFHFNNGTKSWTFYDPRPEFADANTISEFISGQIYWLKIVEDQLSVTLNGSPRDLTCVEGDCWNQTVW